MDGAFGAGPGARSACAPGSGIWGWFMMIIIKFIKCHADFMGLNGGFQPGHPGV